MRSFAILAVTICLCGCGSRGANSPETVSDPRHGTEAGDATTGANQPAGYLKTNDRAFRELEPAVQSQLQSAEKLAREGKLPAAVEALGRLLGERPKNGVALCLRGQIYAQLRQDANAIADFSLAVEAEPQNAGYRTSRGYFQLVHGNTGKAMEDFNEAIRLNPKDAQAYNNRGMTHGGMGELKEALADYKQAIEIDPKYVIAYNNRSLIYTRLDRRKDALADLDHAIQLDPRASGAYENRGVMAYEDHEYAKALADFTQAIKLDGANPSYYSNRREALLKLERFADAQADANKMDSLVRLTALNDAVNRDNHAAKPYVERGSFLLDQHRLDEAISNFDRAAELDANCWRAYAERSRAWLAHNEAGRAVADATRALALEPRDEIYSIRGDAYRKLGDYDKALADYEAAQRFDAEVAETWPLHSQVLNRAGKMKESGDALKRANELMALCTPTKKVHADPKVRPAGYEAPAAAAKTAKPR